MKVANLAGWVCSMTEHGANNGLVSALMTI
jgi:hypothetical protein